MDTFSQNEKEFFRKALLDFDMRMDGRDKMMLRDFEVKTEVVPSAFGSVKVVFRDSHKEILFAVKAEILYQPTDKLVNVSLDSMHKIEDLTLKSQIENYIDSLVLSQVAKDSLKINKDNPDYFWKLYIDVYIFDFIKLSLLQLLMLGVKEVLAEVKLPKLSVFRNEITGAVEYDLVENYEDVTDYERGTSLVLDNLPDVCVFAVINNSIFVDPSEEEWSIADSLIIVASKDNQVQSIQSVGSSIEIQQMFDISSLVKSINYNH